VAMAHRGCDPRPWSHRSWIFPRDPDFERKAARVLDLYEGRWQGTALSARDCVISADEKTSIGSQDQSFPPLLVAYEEGSLALNQGFDALQ
jgi:hypothetical protein